MGAKKLTHVERAQTPKRNAPLLEPPPKMFNHQDVMAHSPLRVAPPVQIQHEAPENYAKVIDRHPAPDGGTPEEPLN
jgi:hypothetical protein